MSSAGIEGRQGKLVNATPKIEFEKYRLANGLEVILSEDANARPDSQHRGSKMMYAFLGSPNHP
jgi:hypothetical protein